MGWRREHGKKLATLIEKEKETEIELQKAEFLNIQAETAKGRAETQKILAEAELRQQEALHQKLENEKIRFELQREKIKFALELVNQIAPNLHETEKLAYMMKVVPILEKFDTIPLQLIPK